mgnify:CR=1 FL=1
MTQSEKRLFLIQSLLKERPEYRQVETPRDPEGQRQLLRGLMNVRPPQAADPDFLRVQDAYLQAERYENFLRTRQGQKLLFLELGVGYNTPVIIKYPFWRMTAANPRATYACLDLGQAAAPREIQKQSICIDGNIGTVLAGLGENTSQSASVEFVRFQRTNYARSRLQAFYPQRACPLGIKRKARLRPCFSG